MKSQLKRKYRNYKEWKRIVWNASIENDGYKVPFLTKCIYALRGFSVNEYIHYRLDKNDWHDYISEFERMNSRAINGNYKFVLDDKLVFEEVVGKYGPVPQNYALVEDGIVHGLHGNGMNNENLLDFLAKYKKTVLKWNDRGGGEGTYVISYEGNRFFANDEEKSCKDVEELFNRKGSAILCEYITQSSFAASLYPHTTNTIRLVCAKRKGASSAEFVIAAQRVGCKKSIPVDNLSSGGFALTIDENTGELGSAIALHGDKSWALIPFDRHPDTGTQLKGKKIPNWKMIVEQVISITNMLPYLKFVAWDILLTEDGFSIIEGNASTGCGLYQMEHGIRNSELGNIYREYGIIK